MPTKVFIDGGEGTTGLRLHERLSARNDIQLLTIDPALRKDESAKAEISNAADIVFLCLPDDAARASVAGITNPNTKVIDASTAHRVLDSWAYGLPELSAGHREKVATSTWICVPGCHASGFNLLVYPLVASGLVAANYPFASHSVTGYSGAGKKVIAAYAEDDRPGYYGTPRQYALGQAHKHLPEMQKISGLAHPPVFNPIIADFYCGMVVTIPLHLRLLKGSPDAQQLHSFFSDFYAGQKLVTVAPWQAEASLPEGMLEPAHFSGRDDLEIFVCGNSEHAILAARFDNLGKGASGAAIQCMNISLGLSEETGLVTGS
ncbi:MAG: N-acetyl-gamma-glutamyl-phosphate reductase [Oscillospiraceae bacterium]|nr:N-acetyl-gamma-glutamyl-phosphate reductase [Oscillospiraceae bacterium]